MLRKGFPFCSSMSVGKLMGLLAELDNDYELSVNDVGNIMVLDKELKQFLGYIDFCAEVVDLGEDWDDE